MNPFSFFPRLPFVALVATPAILVSGCGKRSPDAVPDASPPRSQAFAGNGRPRVFAVNYPLAWFAERIGGDAIDLVYPVEPGVDPAFWEPADAQIADFQSADLILRNGASYAKWAEKVTLPESTQVDTSRAFADALIEVKDAATHSHGKGGEHSHSGTAFTTWLDIRQARSQAQAVRDALAALLPGRAAEFGERFEGLAGQLDLLDADLEAVGKSLAGRPVVASHPIYQYFARRYGLNLQSVLWEPEVVPDDAALADLQKILAAHPAKLMIWEGEPAPESVAKLKALGLESVVFAPCANRPEGNAQDFLSVMRGNLKNLEAAARAP